MLRNRRGQSTLEYALLIAAVVAGLVMMQIYLKRGFGGKVKNAVDDLGEQYDPIDFTSEYDTTYSVTRQDTVGVESLKVTKSQLIEQEQTSRTGSESLEAWDTGEDLYKIH